MITGSALERVSHCPGSTAITEARATTEASAKGTSNHEAIELARQFSNDESVPFINGVLDAVNRSNK